MSTAFNRTHYEMEILGTKMFTGIIEELGQIKSITKKGSGISLNITADLVLNGTKIGDSISVNGCCLTVTNKTPADWSCDLVKETLERTDLGQIKVGEKVNLERAVRFGDRLGGHLVQGHVDEVGLIKEKIHMTDGSWWVTVQSSPQLLRYLITKGSIAVDGVSLTIAAIQNDTFSFAMIPHTANMTSLGLKGPDARVNLEIDLLAKYVDRLTHPYSKKD